MNRIMSCCNCNAPHQYLNFNQNNQALCCNYMHKCHAQYTMQNNIGLHNTIDTNGHIDSFAVTKYFITEYYRNVSSTGWNSVQHLFDFGCSVMLKDKNIGNEYELLNLLSLELIKKANYVNLRIKCTIVNNSNLLINVFGQIQFVSFNSKVSNTSAFTETFILSLIDTTNNKISCTHHIFDF